MLRFFMLWGGALGLVSLTAMGQENAWSRLSSPLAAPRAEVIGGVSHGCLVGAATLPLDGVGYQAMKPQRRRYFGHPQLIAFVKNLGKQAQGRGDHLLIGDLAQPRGGPMSYGHRSHQNGLDVDIWLWQPTKAIDQNQRQRRDMTSFADLAAARVTPQWSTAQRQALFDAATDPRVERIFINPVIKQHLCRTEANPRWLYKVRAWPGHDGHFHVRLRCPSDSPRCDSQPPLDPQAVGCDADLDRWVAEIQEAIRNPPPARPAVPARPKPTLPDACAAVLQGRLP